MQNVNRQQRGSHAKLALSPSYADDRLYLDYPRMRTILREELELIIDERLPILICKLIEAYIAPINKTIRNSHGGVLDLVLINLKTERVAVSGDVEPVVKADAYHPPLKITISLPHGAPITNTRSKPISAHNCVPAWDFHKADLDALYTGAKSIE